jgi:triose/dihydroxyacetone kinase / FAD-AMP lyase (cyclizing)
MARCVAENIVSVGASLARVHVPGRSVEEASGDALKLGEVELGMGIHNE